MLYLECLEVLPLDGYDSPQLRACILHIPCDNELVRWSMKSIYYALIMYLQSFNIVCGKLLATILNLLGIYVMRGYLVSYNKFDNMVLIKNLYKMVLRATILYESECKAPHTVDKRRTNTIVKLNIRSYMIRQN